MLSSLLACLLLSFLSILIQLHLLCSLLSFPLHFPLAWVLLRVAPRGLTPLGSQQAFQEIKKTYFARMRYHSW